jgi:hypothetical protein
MPRETLLREYANLLIQELQLDRDVIRDLKLVGLYDVRKSRGEEGGTSSGRNRSVDPLPEKDTILNRYVARVKQMWVRKIGREEAWALTEDEKKKASDYLRNELRYSSDDISKSRLEELANDLKEGKHKNYRSDY